MLFFQLATKNQSKSKNLFGTRGLRSNQEPKQPDEEELVEVEDRKMKEIEEEFKTKTGKLAQQQQSNKRKNTTNTPTPPPASFSHHLQLPTKEPPKVAVQPVSKAPEAKKVMRKVVKPPLEVPGERGHGGGS